jgi:peptide/nickel transport system substrate-binding protein
VHLKEASLRLMLTQLNPAVQIEPTLSDPRMRRAFMHALDREELSEVVNGARDRAAWSLLSADDPLFPAVRDGLRPYVYDPARARTLLAEVGWSAAADGSLRHGSDGRRLRTSVWGTPGREQEMVLVSSYFRSLGMDVEEYMMPPARFRDREYRATFPGWISTGGNILDIMSEPAAGPSNRWRGNENGYENPRAKALVDTLESTIVESERLQAMRTIHEHFLAEFPVVPIFFLLQYTAVHRSVKAFDDIAGADGHERLYGGYARNAHLWDLAS